MRAFRSFMLLVGVTASLSACDRQEKAPPPDLSFLDSLQFASPLSPDANQQTVSPEELGLAAAAPAAEETTSASSQRSAPRKSSARRSTSSSSGASSAGTTARQPRVVTVKNTKRDAIIGAGAGAVIGAVAGGPRNRVKGAVIGGVVGGVAGAVVGSTIDKSTRVEY